MRGIERDNEQMIREGWFANHQVLDHRLLGYDRGKAPVEILVWGKPGTGIYRVRYLLYEGTLMVSGDIGEATYCWHPRGGINGLRWIAGLSLDYFHGKCTASEDGRCSHWYEWDGDGARKTIREYFKDERSCKGYKKYLESSFPSVIGDRDTFLAELRCGSSDAYDTFGDDWYEWVPNVGNVIPMRCQGHLIGLKMALLEKE